MPNQPTNLPAVYISGPISKPSIKKGRYGKNIKPAMQMYCYLWSAGFTPYCPHLSYWLDKHMENEFGFGMSHEEWMEQDLFWLSKCDAVLRLPGESLGADEECIWARKHGIPVFDDIHKLQEHFDREEK